MSRPGVCQLHSRRLLIGTEENNDRLEMWANAQRHGRPAEYSWRPLFNAAKFVSPLLEYRAVTLPRRETR